jgi:hypothetical protein
MHATVVLVVYGTVHFKSALQIPKLPFISKFNYVRVDTFLFAARSRLYQIFLFATGEAGA